ASWGPVYDEAGHQVGVQGTERDITQRKLTEQALRESEQRFRDLLERVQLVAIMTDLHGTITFCNNYTLDITRLSKDDVIGRPAKEFIDPEYPIRVSDERTVTMPADRTEALFEGSILTKDGTRRSIQWSSTLLRDSADRATGFASLGVDVTE